MIKKTRADNTFTLEARKTAITSRQHRSIFNRYLASLNATGGKREASRRAKIDAIDARLSAGVKERLLPVWRDGRRRGSAPGTVPLLPADRARLLAQRRDLTASLGPAVRDGLRAEFLRVLPAYAAAQGWDRAVLLEVGVPVADCDAAGIGR